MSDWRPIETAPTSYGTRVLLVVCKGRSIVIGTRIYDGDWEAEEGGLLHPSHWMPLPEPPKERP